MFIDNVVNTVTTKYQIPQKDILIFIDNASSHTSGYAMYNLRRHKVEIIFNCPNTPALNIVELVFADLKYSVRKENKSVSKDLI